MKVKAKYALGAAAVAAGAAALLSPALFGGRALIAADGVFLFAPWGETPRALASNYLLVDQYLYLHPFARFLHENVLAGRLPLWNPMINGGVPFVASMQAAALFPINLLLSPVDPFYASGWGAFVKLALAGAFMVLYLRGLGAGAAAAALSGFAFCLSGYMVVWLGHPHVNCAMWLPLLFWLIDQELARPKIWAAFAAACALLFLGGHPPTALHMTLASAAYFLWRSRAGRRYRDSGLFASAVAAGALLAAPQLLPFLEYVGEGSVAAASESLARWNISRSPATLLHLLLPYLTGAPTTGYEGLGALFGLGPHDNFNERTAFVGVSTLILAAVAAAVRRGRTEGFHLSLAAAALAGIYGLPPVGWIFAWTPLLNQTSPGRLSLWLVFSLSVLAGLGLETLAKESGEAKAARARRTLWAAAGVCVVAVMAASHYVGISELSLKLAARRFNFTQAAWALACAAAVPLAAWRARRALPFCAGLVALELLVFGYGYNPAVPRSVYYPRPEAVEAIVRDHSLFRVTALGPVLPPNTNMLFGLQDVRGQDFISVRRYEELLTGTAGDFHFLTSSPRLPPTASLLNVKYVLTPPETSALAGAQLIHGGDASVFRMKRVTPRALLVYAHEVIGEPAGMLARLAAEGFDPSRVLLLEEDPPASFGASSQAGAAAPENVRVASYAPDEVLVEASLPRPGFLLLLDVHYPGWRAWAGGREVPVLRANYVFRAVALPAGFSKVVFRYEPASFRWGVLLSFLAAALILLVYRRGDVSGKKS